MSFTIDGKVALVTGANRGIGKVIVDTLVAHGASKVYAAVRRLETADAHVDEHGPKVVPIQVDLEKPETIVAAAAEASDVELVINNAGVLRESTPLGDKAIEDLEYEINVNVVGLIRMAQAFAPVLKKNGGGAFVQLNSVASQKAFPGFATYCASKAAAYSITQSLKDLLREQGTQVVSVHPGPIDTDMAHTAGFGDMVQPPSLVADSIVQALKAGEFHAWPDSMAKQIGSAYAEFASIVIEADLVEG